MEKKEYVKLWLSYASYFEPYSAAEVGRLVLAMINYKSSGVDPEFSGSERFVWPAIKRDIDEQTKAQEDAAEVRRGNGKKGGRPKSDNNQENQDGFSETENNLKNQDGFSETEKTYGHGQGHGNGHGQKETLTPPIVGVNAKKPAVAAVVSDFLDRVNPAASQKCLEELTAYAESMGEAVCRRAIDIALDAKKANWPYIRAILRDKQAKGVKSLSDWDAAEAGRATTKGNQPGQDVGASKERIRKNVDWLDEFLASQEAANEV